LPDRVRTHEATYFNHFGEVSERSGEAIYFINDDRIDLTRMDIAQELFQCGALHGATRETSVVIVIRQHSPAFMLLAEDKSVAGFALGLERVERLLQSFLGGFAGIDSTPDVLLSHRGDPEPFLRPKKAGPDQRVPVTFRAISERLRQLTPRYS
jgi:hypothetical protein